MALRRSGEVVGGVWTYSPSTFAVVVLLVVIGMLDGIVSWSFTVPSLDVHTW